MELRFREFGFACEIMQMTHCRRHDLAESRVMCATQFVEHGPRDVFLTGDDHRLSPLCTGRAERIVLTVLRIMRDQEGYRPIPFFQIPIPFRYHGLTWER